MDEGPMQGRMTVVVAEDDPSNLLMMEEVLSAAGHRVHGAKNGYECLSLVGEHRPDVIVMDAMMPDLDGYQAASMLRQDPDFQHIPVVFVTAADEVEGRRRVEDVGGVVLLAKPFDLDELVRQVEAAVAGRGSAPGS